LKTVYSGEKSPLFLCPLSCPRAFQKSNSVILIPTGSGLDLNVASYSTCFQRWVAVEIANMVKSIVKKEIDCKGEF